MNLGGPPVGRAPYGAAKLLGCRQITMGLRAPHPELILRHFRSRPGLYILGAGASAGLAPLGGAREAQHGDCHQRRFGPQMITGATIVIGRIPRQGADGASIADA